LILFLLFLLCEVVVEKREGFQKVVALLNSGPVLAVGTKCIAAKWHGFQGVLEPKHFVANVIADLDCLFFVFELFAAAVL
jgi:hypothetical protein